MSVLYQIDKTVWLIAIVAVLAVIDIFWLFFLSQKIKNLLGGQNAKTIEQTLKHIQQELEKTNIYKKEVSGYLETAEKRLASSIRGVGTVRFNPFKGSGEGGNQSFSTSFINEAGNGVVISSLYSRERVSIFSKPIQNFQSEFELTDEERQAIEKAKLTLRKS